MKNERLSGVLTEGKTKIIYQSGENPDEVIVASKDAITKNDDPTATRTMASKAVHATATTCNVFSLLKKADIPVAFNEQVSDTEFSAPRCRMIPLEVVARRYAVGSYLKRFPNLASEEGVPPHRFHRLVIELFLKTTGGVFSDWSGEERELTRVDESSGRRIDDPFVADWHNPIWYLRHPKVPGWDSSSDLHCSIFRSQAFPEGRGDEIIENIEQITRRTFLLLESAWGKLGCRLIDFKIEFGVGSTGDLLVADVIDNDSWRLRTTDWQELSKQLFRDNADMGLIADKYALVAGLVEKFAIPKQALVLWRGSSSDRFPEVLELPGIEKVEVTISGHKSPIQVLETLERIQADFPEKGVIIAVVGMSNGLGPTLAARTTWPVITVPTSHNQRPHDVWSSLETPSQVPLLTVLNPKNAVLAALNIFSQTNPIVCAFRQEMIEQLDK